MLMAVSIVTMYRMPCLLALVLYARLDWVYFFSRVHSGTFQVGVYDLYLVFGHILPGVKVTLIV